MYTVEELQALMKTLNEQGLEHLKAKNGDMEIELFKSTGVAKKTPAENTETTDETSDIEGEEPREFTDQQSIKSPIVGTFYRASEPEAAPFIKEGDPVHEETVVGIVEAMKLFNEVSADVEGEIVDILVEDGAFVEHGEPLFIVKEV
ncbi:acetyl-CoA carboxylase biotin carboxyl carrier protein [Salicibibacter kimchii]|nr:acetyl-CoA carboxylase biotin carboxyl carrier protein [Salicibibacter kimchii]